MHDLDMIGRTAAAAAAEHTPHPSIIRSRAAKRRRVRQGAIVTTGIVAISILGSIGWAQVDSGNPDRDDAVMTADAPGAAFEIEDPDQTFDPPPDVPEPWNVVVFLRATATNTQILMVESLLSGSSEVLEFEFMSKEETLREFEESFAGDPELLGTISVETMPPSFRARVTDPDSTLITMLEGLAAIRAVVVQDDGDAETEPRQSDDPQLVAVPSLAGLDLGPGLDALDAVGFLAGDLGGSSDARCPVESTDPPAATLVEFGTQVDILLAECNSPPTSGVPEHSMDDIMLLASPSDVFVSEAFAEVGASYAEGCAWAVAGDTNAVLVDGVFISAQDIRRLLDAIACDGGVVIRTDGSVSMAELSPEARLRVDSILPNLTLTTDIES